MLVQRKVERSSEGWLYSISDCSCECAAFVGAHQCKGNWKMHSWKLGKRFRWLTELDDYISTAGFALFGLSVSVTEPY